ncbi:hypothetical protein [Blastococcus sp. SYSU DS0617]
MLPPCRTIPRWTHCSPTRPCGGGDRAAHPRGLLSGSGRQVRSLGYRDAGEVDPAVVQEFLDHAVQIGAGRRAR